ncbi:hypothetical protein OEA41_006497 [Lepraria neglecta]|uniref:Uncharacterized protein n=1 Tax=Lepraria neglecta TaxID=209136 RepID=A0AAD9ZBP5_9LECA|nr:hypothetical protein OEA41_006497 [Lepraria neglecta]
MFNRTLNMDSIATLSILAVVAGLVFMRQYTAISRTITDGYTKAIRRIAIFVWNTDLISWQYSKQGLPFILPTPAIREIIMLSQEHISWLIDQKDSTLSVKEIRKKNLVIDWLLPTVMDPLHKLFMFDVVHRDLPRNLGPLQPAILEEKRNGLEATMGLNDDGWRGFCLW